MHYIHPHKSVFFIHYSSFVCLLYIFSCIIMLLKHSLTHSKGMGIIRRESSDVSIDATHLKEKQLSMEVIEVPGNTPDEVLTTHLLSNKYICTFMALVTYDITLILVLILLLFEGTTASSMHSHFIPSTHSSPFSSSSNSTQPLLWESKHKCSSLCLSRFFSCWSR